MICNIPTSHGRSTSFIPPSRQHKCLANGVPPTTLASKAVITLEMVQYNFPVMRSLDRFPALCTLRIVSQDLDCIRGLEACPALEELWICETPVSRIEGLGECKRLRKLLLYGWDCRGDAWLRSQSHDIRLPPPRISSYMNRIRKIEGLDALVELETLWLNDNGSGVEVA